MSETLDPKQAEIHRLIEEQSALADMQRTPGWVVFEKYVRAWLHSHEQRLMSGGVDDLLEYKLLSGRMDGVRQVLSIPDMVERALEHAKTPAENWQDEFLVEPDEGPEYTPGIHLTREDNDRG